MIPKCKVINVRPEDLGTSQNLYQAVRQRLTSCGQDSISSEVGVVHKVKSFQKLPAGIADDLCNKDSDKKITEQIQNVLEPVCSSLKVTEIVYSLTASCEYLGERMGRILKEHASTVESEAKGIEPESFEKLLFKLADLLRLAHPRHSLELEAAAYWLREISNQDTEESNKANWADHAPLLSYCDCDDQPVQLRLPERFKAVALDTLKTKHPLNSYKQRNVKSRYDSLMERHLDRLIEDKAEEFFGKGPPKDPSWDCVNEITAYLMYEILDEIDRSKRPDLQALHRSKPL